MANGNEAGFMDNTYFGPMPTANPSTTAAPTATSSMFPMRPTSYMGIPYLNSYGGANPYPSIDYQIMEALQPGAYGAQFGRWNFGGVTPPPTAPTGWGQPPNGNGGYMPPPSGGGQPPIGGGVPPGSGGMPPPTGGGIPSGGGGYTPGGTQPPVTPPATGTLPNIDINSLSQYRNPVNAYNKLQRGYTQQTGSDGKSHWVLDPTVQANRFNQIASLAGNDPAKQEQMYAKFFSGLGGGGQSAWGGVMKAAGVNPGDFYGKYGGFANFINSNMGAGNYNAALDPNLPALPWQSGYMSKQQIKGLLGGR